MSRWRDDLHQRLEDQARAGLSRQLIPNDRCALTVHRQGRALLNFASNDYLALADHPHLIERVAQVVRDLGVGAGASRLVTGHLELHEKLEARFARFKHAEAALLATSGYTANLAALSALVQPGDRICLDKLNHASLIDAARVTAAEVRTFAHLDYAKLKRLLKSAKGRCFIVTDSVFSMDGDTADLPALLDLRDQYRAVLIVDEAHGTGVLGPTGAGLADQQGVSGQIDVTISTASKALGSLGGIITADRVVIDTLIHAARPFIYSTAIPPMQVAAIDAALDIVRDEPERRERLQTLTQTCRSRLRERGWDVFDDPTPIIPVITGSAASALALSEKLAEAGVLAPAIRPPTVPPESARVRLSLRADMTDEHLDTLIHAIGTPG